MNVLFVSSGNSKNFEVSPFIKAQGESIQEKGINVSYFTIKNNGLIGYLKSALILRKHLKINKIDIIHAHYTLCAWTSILSFTRIPIVLSIMGDDAYGSYIGENKIEFRSRYLTVLTFLIQPFVSAIISKSKNIDKYVYRKKISAIIPNGIKLDSFIYDNKGSRDILKLKENLFYLLFLGDKNDHRKNFKLVSDSLKVLNNKNIEVIAPYPVSHNDVPEYLNSVDVLVLSAFMEGSPNVIKEAMACNCPIVSTDVGDVKWIIDGVKGCYIADFNPADFSMKIENAISYASKYGRTKGRDRIVALGLDADKIANRVIDVYMKLLKSKS